MTDQAYLPQNPSGNHMIMGFVLGAMVGAGVALLLAPATGQETRRVLGERAKDLGNQARHWGSQAREKVGAIKDTLGRHADQVKSEVRSTVQSGC